MELVKQNKELSSLVKALEAEWLNDIYVAQKLKYIVEKAITHDNKWEEYEDFLTKLKAIQTMIKLKDKNYWSNNVNIWFFNAPKVNEHLEY